MTFVILWVMLSTAVSMSMPHTLEGCEKWWEITELTVNGTHGVYTINFGENQSGIVDLVT